MSRARCAEKTWLYGGGRRSRRHSEEQIEINSRVAHTHKTRRITIVTLTLFTFSPKTFPLFLYVSLSLSLLLPNYFFCLPQLSLSHSSVWNLKENFASLKQSFIYNIAIYTSLIALII